MTIQREKIVGAALELLGSVGADGLTMRALAKELQIQAPTIYWHFSGKQALFDAMADAMVARVEWDLGGTDDWAAILTRFAAQLRQALLRYRDGGRVFAGTFPVTENIFRVGDRIVDALLAAGCSHREAAWSLFTVNYFVIGFVLEEQAVRNGEGTAKPAAIGRAVSSHAAEHPDAAAAMLELLGENVDDRFAFGLDAIIAGLRLKIAG